MILQFTKFSILSLFSVRTSKRWQQSNGRFCGPTPEYQGWGLAFAHSDTEAYGGRLAKARGLTREAVDAA